MMAAAKGVSTPGACLNRLRRLQSFRMLARAQELYHQAASIANHASRQAIESTILSREAAAQTERAKVLASKLREMRAQGVEEPSAAARDLVTQSEEMILDGKRKLARAQLLIQKSSAGIRKSEQLIEQASNMEARATVILGPRDVFSESEEE